MSKFLTILTIIGLAAVFTACGNSNRNNKTRVSPRVQRGAQGQDPNARQFAPGMPGGQTTQQTGPATPQVAGGGTTPGNGTSGTPKVITTSDADKAAAAAKAKIDEKVVTDTDVDAKSETKEELSLTAEEKDCLKAIRLITKGTSKVKLTTPEQEFDDPKIAVDDKERKLTLHNQDREGYVFTFKLIEAKKDDCFWRDSDAGAPDEDKAERFEFTTGGADNYDTKRVRDEGFKLKVLRKAEDEDVEDTALEFTK